MLFKNKEIEKQKETERVALIEKVAENFFDYREVVNEKQKYLSDLSHHVITNSIVRAPQYSLQDMEKGFTNEKERNNVLAYHLGEYGEEGHHVRMLKEVIETYKDAQIQFKTSIEDLKHFYKVTKYPSSKVKKIILLENVLVPITDGNSEKADLLPLNELEGAYRNIEEFKESHSMRFIEKYLERDRKGNLAVNEHNIYIVNPYYFSDRVNKLKSNIKGNLENAQKKIGKFTRHHKTKEQLRRYLQY